MLATVHNIVFDVPEMSPHSWVSVESQGSKILSEFLLSPAVSTLQSLDPSLPCLPPDKS